MTEKINMIKGEKITILLKVKFQTLITLILKILILVVFTMKSNSNTLIIQPKLFKSV